jgi:hypothetical protein
VNDFILNAAPSSTSTPMQFGMLNPTGSDFAFA